MEKEKNYMLSSTNDKFQSGTVARGITFIQSREIWIKLSTHVPTDSGKKKIPLHNDVSIPKVFI